MKFPSQIVFFQKYVIYIFGIIPKEIDIKYRRVFVQYAQGIQSDHGAYALLTTAAVRAIGSTDIEKLV